MNTFYLIGSTIAKSLSPAMHNAAFAALSLPYNYECKELPESTDIAAIIAEFTSEQVPGFNITMPFKEAVVPYITLGDDAVRAIGSINTAVFNGSGYTGYNTDWSGFLASLKNDYCNVPTDKHCVVLGAGGAARAIIYALKTVGAKVTIANRTYEKAVLLAQEFDVDATSAEEGRIFNEADLVINCTPADLAHMVKLDGCYYDCNYMRSDTGKSMLVWQGAHAFELWTGQSAPIAQMKEAVYGNVRQR